MGRATLAIISVFAQLERENIRERTRMGMIGRVKEGKWMGGGRVPFGYDYDATQNKLVPNQDADKVRQIYDLYLKGYSLCKIAQMLGLKYERLALQILTRKSNYGVIEYNGEIYPGLHEPIISKETFEQAMDLMHERSVTRMASGDYLLTGLLVCGKCGAKMRYQKWGKTDCKIVCYSLDKNKPHLIKDPNCDNVKIWASELEDIVVKDLFAFAFHQTQKPHTLSQKENVLDGLRRSYDDQNKAIKRLYTLYANGDDGALATLDELKKKLATTRSEIERELEHNTLTNKVTALIEKLENVKDGWDSMSAQEKKNILNAIIEKVVIDGENVEIFYKLKDYQM
jgi:site-specific DNA recombinase